MLLTCIVRAIICEAVWSTGTCSTCVCSSNFPEEQKLDMYLLQSPCTESPLQCAQNVPLPSQKQFSLQYGNACVQLHSEQIVFPLSYLGVRVPTQKMGRLRPILTAKSRPMWKVWLKPTFLKTILSFQAVCLCLVISLPPVLSVSGLFKISSTLLWIVVYKTKIKKTLCPPIITFFPLFLKKKWHNKTPLYLKM